MLTEGAPFPDFSLADQDGNVLTQNDLRGTPCVVYFYPKDDTSGCTAQACSLRDHVSVDPSVRVIGVSPDNPKSHRKFVDKYSLNFTLLADVEHKLAEACGVWVEKSMYGKKYMGVERSTFVLDADGVVTKIHRKVVPQDHAKFLAEQGVLGR